MADFMMNSDEDCASDEEDTLMDDEEDYTYESDEEEDDLPPSLERVLSEEGFRIPEGKCIFVNYKEMYPNLLKLITTASGILGVDSGVAELLLQEFKWNMEELLAAYCQNSDETLVRAKVKMDSKCSPPQTIADSCFICMDDFSDENDVSFSLSCGHPFHRSCYVGYIENAVGDGPTCVEMTCPQYKCDLRIPSVVVKELCHTGLVCDDGLAPPQMARSSSGSLIPSGSKAYESFVKHLIKNFIEQSSFMRWCPAPGCEHISIGRGVDQVTCVCSCQYCIKCQKPSHMPAPCSLVGKWDEKNASESENMSWLLVYTKPCPKCNRRIEKNQGCNHMTCSVCRHGFCWICMSDWSTHDGSYYQCNKFKKGEEADTNNIKLELERYMHNFSRYLNHRKALTIAAEKLSDLCKGKFSTVKEGDAYTVQSFLREAFEQVVECRRVLQYSYIVGHYSDSDTSEYQLFEFQQQMLEGNTEALNHLTEKVEMLELDEEERAHMKNLTGVTKKFMSLMMTADDLPMRKV